VPNHPLPTVDIPDETLNVPMTSVPATDRTLQIIHPSHEHVELGSSSTGARATDLRAQPVFTLRGAQYPQRIPEDLSHPAAEEERRDMMDFAFQVASHHPDAITVPTRKERVETDLSTRRSFVSCVRDHCTASISWLKEKSQGFGWSKSAASLELDSGSRNRSTKIFAGASLSNVGHLIRKTWAESRKHGPSLLSSRVTAT
jgi:hypothetical protein